MTDTDAARQARYAEAIHGEWWSGRSDYAERAAQAVVAVADAEQAEMRAEVQRVTAQRQAALAEAQRLQCIEGERDKYAAIVERVRAWRKNLPATWPALDRILDGPGVVRDESGEVVDRWCCDTCRDLANS